MFEVELEWSSIKIISSGVETYFIEAANSSHHNTMVELKHSIANLLQQWWIFRLRIMLRQQRIRVNWTLWHIFKLERGFSLGASVLQHSIPC